MSLCADCVKGVTHEGTATGTYETIGGIPCYVATPKGDYAKDKALIYCSDIYGIKLVNHQLLADDFAANGFYTVIPDYLQDDVAPPDAMEPGSTWDLPAWLANHGSDKVRPPLDAVIVALKERGVTSFAATGYCFGGRYVFDLAIDNVIKVAVANHPSLLTFPDDLEKYHSESKAALLINSCSLDWALTPAAAAQADKVFAKFSPGYRRDNFEGCSHGFAVRGDLSDPLVKGGKEGAFKSAVEWLSSKL